MLAGGSGLGGRLFEPGAQQGQQTAGLLLPQLVQLTAPALGFQTPGGRKRRGLGFHGAPVVKVARAD